MGPPTPSRNFEQNSPITTILRQICEAYPESSCLRELLQNADDAQASEIEYILDTTTYHGKPLINEGLEAYHGPALLVRNNSVFTDDDFTSLASIGDSRKRDDPVSTGKYGQGFNSCFHWTDGPWILSRQWLLFLDPHREWSRDCGGPTYDFVECRDSLEMQNHLETFKSAKVETSHALDGTVIRIPLRTKSQAIKSKIVNREISTEEITKALHELGEEIKNGGMLFLRHVRKVTAKIDDNILWQAHATGATDEDTQAMRSISGAFGEMYASLPEEGQLEKLSKGFHVNVEYLAQSSSSVHSFFVQHTMIRSSAKAALNDWARKRKLFPWVAIAAPVDLTQRDALRGRLFSCLRMPIETGQPVHIHGLFAIVPDRSRLSSSGPDSEWNRFMFEECVSVAWTDLLFSRRHTAWKHESFRLWPHISTSESRELWSPLDDVVLDQVITGDLPVWNTADCCVTLRDGFFAPDGKDMQMYGNAFSSINLPLVCLESCMYDKVLLRASKLAKQVPTISPRLLRQFLRENGQRQVPREHSSLLLEYCLLDFIRNATDFGIQTQIRYELRNIRLWPTMQMSLTALEDTTFFLPRGAEEMMMFKLSRQSETLDLDSLTPRVVELLEVCAKRLSTFIRYRAISDLESDWCNIYPLQPPSTTTDFCPRASQDDLTIRNIWSWICARCKDEGESSIISTKSLNNLFLVPVNGLRIRRFASGDAERLTLIAQDDDWICELLDHEIIKTNRTLDLVLDVRCLPPKAVKLLRSIAKRRPDTAFADPNDLRSLVAWLVANKDGLKSHPVRHKEVLIRQLRILTEQYGLPLLGPGKASLRRQILQLPIFKQVYAVAPYKEHLSRMTAIEPSSRAIQIVSSLPPIPTIPSLTFYEPFDLHEQYLVDFYRLLENISPDELIFEHLMPFFKEQRDPTLAEVKLSLIHFALDNTSRPSDSWKARFCRLDLVPKASTPGISGLQFRSLADTVDPTAPLSDLFFENEDMFPEPGFFERHRDTLISCGIIRELTPEMLLKRAQTFAGSQKDMEEVSIKIKRMLSLPLPAAFPLLPASLEELRSLKWLPASSSSFEGFRLMSPADCRAADEKELVDKALGIVEADLNRNWKQLLGWDQTLKRPILTTQLERSLALGLNDRIDSVLTYLEKFDDCQFLKQVPCTLSRRGEYLLAERLLLPGSLISQFSLSPYLDEVDPSFAKKHTKLLRTLDIRRDISFSDVLRVQDDVLKATQSDPLSEENLNVVIALLEIATNLESEAKDLSKILIPDTERRLRPRMDIVHGDRNIKGRITSFNFVHPRISPDLVQRLDLEKSVSRAIRLDIEFEDEDEDEYVPREKLSTTISDTLGRYPIDSTFGEFLANANDCGATQISWILDDCAKGGYGSSTLLDEELKGLQGPALFVFNNGVFSDKDFEGFKDIGHGGKTDDVTSTGMFGRGAMTMYHFTDVPMLISGSSFLILDPQQQCLPRNKHGQHKAGMKIPLNTARRLFPDQLRPFDGLQGYSIEQDSYDGTLYRLPLRMTNRTLLKEASAEIGVEQTKTLLEDYFSTARMSLLFLRNVTTIDFSIRGHPASWSVKSERSNSSFEEIFQHVGIESKHGAGESCKLIWRIGIMDIEEAPDALANPGRRANKITECGLAACVEVIGDSSKKEALKQRVFCTLPTLSLSGLPVSIHASFAITGDRKTIPFEDFEKGSPIKEWNRWLLTKCIPDFYIEFLKDLAPRLGMASFKYWPTTSTLASIESFGKVVQEAFWTRLASQQYETYQLYPLLDTHDPSEQSTPLKTRTGGKVRKLFKVGSLKSAQFDVLPTEISLKLRPLFRKLCPSLVHPPLQVWQRMTMANIHRQAVVLEAEYVCTLFKNDSNCTILEDFLQSFQDDRQRDEAIEMLLRTAVPNLSLDSPHPIEITNNCRIIPKLDQTLGTVRFRDKSSAPFPDRDLLFLPNDTEADLFSNHAHSLIKPTLFRGPASNFTALRSALDAKIQTPRNPLRDTMTKSSNMREIGVADIHSFLAHVESSSTPTSTSGSSHNWIVQFWSYLNPRLNAFLAGEGSGLSSAPVSDLLKHLKLQNAGIYRYAEGEEWRYITPEQFEQGPYIIQPKTSPEVELCNLLSGVKVLDPECVPSQLRRAESNLKSALAFRRLLRALATKSKGASIKLFEESARREFFDFLRAAVQAFAKVDDFNSQDRRTMALLPVWPRYNCRPDSSTDRRYYISADGALACPHKAMLQPWNQNLDKFIDPDFVRTFSNTLKALGCSIMTVQSAWKYLEPNLPSVLKTEQLQEFLRCIEYLANESCKPTTKIAPNGLGVLCSPSALFDHEDAIFLAAFGESDDVHFLYPTFRNKRSFWISIGLRSRPKAGIMHAVDFLECVNQIVARLSFSSSRDPIWEDAEKVTGYLRFFDPGFGKWPDEAWTTIAQAEMYRADPDVISEPSFRRTRMLSLARESTPQCINSAASKTHKRVLWSQRPFLKDPPDAAVYTKLPNGGRPEVQLVYDHLQFLINMRNNIEEPDLPEYLRDLQATYSYLQEHHTATVLIPSIREAKVWLNLPTTDLASISSSQFDSSLKSAKSLCFNAPLDTHMMERAKNFLVPYETLLKALGCQSMVQPPKKSVASHGDKQRPMDRIWIALRDMRKQGQLVDVIFEAEGQQFFASRNIMAASSGYCRAQFLGAWGNILGPKVTIQIEDLSSKTLDYMVEFAYTGAVQWPQLRDHEDISEVADTLDELLDLLNGANMWLIDILHDLTEAYILDNSETFIRPDNVDSVKELADVARAKRLVGHCDEFIRVNARFVQDCRDMKQ
ncbi:MAG: hypothetical protein Q9225_005692 [Loekoesia sp. 1 TL-2023]